MNKNKEEYFYIKKRPIYLMRAWTIFIFAFFGMFALNVYILNKGIIHFKGDISNCIVYLMTVVIGLVCIPILAVIWFGGIDKL